MTNPSGLLLNATGNELSNDMACSSTIEPYKLETDADAFFYDEHNPWVIDKRVELMVEVIQRNRQKISGLIVDNNPLGQALFAALGNTEKFVTSIKRPGTNLHWHYIDIHRDAVVGTFFSTDNAVPKQVHHSVHDHMFDYTLDGLKKEIKRLKSVADKKAEDLFNAIAHGDEKHRAWLKAAVDAFYQGKPIPEEQKDSILLNSSR